MHKSISLIIATLLLRLLSDLTAVLPAAVLSLVHVNPSYG
jgi:hypothetical protein